ncbi:MAG: thioredoxin domain-containing protein [Pseudomonadota bacterium]
MRPSNLPSKKPVGRLLLISATIAAIALGAFATAASARPAANWNKSVVRTPAATHVLGNPAAKVKLAEYVSYTCSHCAHFTVDAEGPLRLAYVSTGTVAIEVKHLLRDPIDLTAALLAHCGPSDKFFGNHLALMRGQARWIEPLTSPTPAQRSRWTSGAKLERLRAIAGDFGLYRLLEARGYSRPQLDHCLADDALAQRLSAQGADAQKLGITATPSFAINGTLLAGTHDWATLEPQLKLRM